jgi:ABC-type bacteriocin/lantibiotic exporter with double-glycine peptidase domain
MKRRKTPVLLQLEARECGAVALGIMLAYYHKYVPLAELRAACGTSRDGVKISGIVRAARHYGMNVRVFKRAALADLPLPVVVFWKFNHFLVIEGLDAAQVAVNDPAAGRRSLPRAYFDDHYSGIVLTFAPTENFAPGGKKPSPWAALGRLMQPIKKLCAALFMVTLLRLGGWLMLAAAVGLGLPRWLTGDTGAALPLWLLGGSIFISVTLGLLEQRVYAAFWQRSIAAELMPQLIRLPVSFFAGRYDDEISGRVMGADALFGMVAQCWQSSAQVVQGGLLVWLLWALDGVWGSLAVGLGLMHLGWAWYRQQLAHQHQAATRHLHEQYGTLLMQADSQTLQLHGEETAFQQRLSAAHTALLNANQPLTPLTTLDGVLPLISVLGLGLVGLWRIPDISLSILIMGLLWWARLLTSLPHLFTLGRLLPLLEQWQYKLEDIAHTAPHTPHLAKTDAALLHFEAVSFGYDDTLVIQSLHLALAAGQCVAVVGRSGSGKSTLLKLAAGLFVPQTGKIASGETCRLAWVDDADPLLIPGTIAENLRLFQPLADAAALHQAAADACLSALERPIAELSPAEKQCVEIARALLNQPTLLILDEATSGLDTLTEHRLLDNLRRRGCACLISTHRQSCVQACDVVLQLEAGHLVQMPIG